ncbi:hypothetical protein T439DRAFT_297274 [Meredithblackwellia eburnea MCA 4105]
MATSTLPPSPSASHTQAKRAPANTDQSGPSGVTKRLTNELMALMMGSPAGISAFPASDGDLTFWKGTLAGAEATYYEGHVYAISLTFPPTYPYAAPNVRFESTCYHPNVALTGEICLDILKEKWSPMLSVSTILVSLQSLLGEPNNASPLNVEAAELWDNAEAFKIELAKHYRPIEDDE